MLPTRRDGVLREGAPEPERRPGLHRVPLGTGGATDDDLTPAAHAGPSTPEDRGEEGRSDPTSAPGRRTVRITWEDLQRSAEEATDLDAIVRRELERTGEADLVPLEPLTRDEQPRPPRWSAGLLVALSVVILSSAIMIGGRDATPAPPTAVTTRAGPRVSSPPSNMGLRGHHLTPHELTARLVFTAPCWIQVVADGRTRLSATIPNGRKVVRARRSLELTLGNAGAVRLRVNGRSIRTGAPGQVVHLAITLNDGRVLVRR